MNTLCPLCCCLVETYAPGESYAEIGGAVYHVGCANQLEHDAEAFAKRVMAKIRSTEQKADEMQQKIALARLIRDVWGPGCWEIPEEATQ